MTALSPRAKFIHEIYDLIGEYASPEQSLEHLMGALVGNAKVSRVSMRVDLYLERVGAVRRGAWYGTRYATCWQDILAHAATLSNELPLPPLEEWIVSIYYNTHAELRVIYPQWEEGETLSEFTRRIVLAEQNDAE